MRLGLPTVVLIRRPADAVSSYLVRRPTLTPDDALLEYLDFYRTAWPARDGFVVAPFDLVVSALAVHHLRSELKRDLFARVADALGDGGVFVLGDVVIPERPEDAQIEIDWVVDLPDRAADQVLWLGEAGFTAGVVWSQRDLAVIRAVRA